MHLLDLAFAPIRALAVIGGWYAARRMRKAMARQAWLDAIAHR